jgi:hypothetical protein
MNLLNESSYYFINIDLNKGFDFFNEMHLMDIIDNEYLSNLFFLFRNSKTSIEKINHMRGICILVTYLFDHNSLPKERYEHVVSKIGKENTSKISGKMHGYFRHSINDNRPGNETKE